MNSRIRREKLPLERLPVKKLAAISEAEAKTIIREIFQDVTGVELSDKLTAQQLSVAIRTLDAQLSPYYISTTLINSMIGNALDVTDVTWHTTLRLVEVFSNEEANHTSSDADNPDSVFNHTVSDPAVAGSLAAASIVPALVGAWLRYHQMKKARDRRGIKHLTTALQAAAATKTPSTETDILAGINDLLERKVRREQLKVDPKTDRVIGTNKFANFINRTRNSKPVRVINSAWNFLANTALIFWPAWMITVLIVGFAASYALPALPIVVGVSFLVAGVIKGVTEFMKYRAKKKEALLAKNKDKDTVDAEKAAADQEVAETERMTSEANQRLVFKTAHARFNAIFGVKKPEKKDAGAVPTKAYKNTYTAAVAMKEKVVVLVNTQPEPVHVPSKAEKAAATKKAPPTFTPAELKEHKRQVDETLQSSIGRRLLGSKHQRRGHIAINMINDAIGYYTLSAFVLWLVGSAFFAVGLAPGAIAAVFGSIGALVLGSTLPGISAAFSMVMGGVFSLKAFAVSRSNQLNFEKEVYTRLSEVYKPEKSPATVQETFDKLDNDVNERKAYLKDKLALKQAIIRQKIKIGEPIDEKERYLLTYDLNKVDVYNDRYFRTLEQSPSVWTRIKQASFRAYKALNAAQTWIFVTRSLFLAGAALAGVCLLFGPGAGIAFVAIAATMAVAGVACKLVQMHMNKKASDKAFFARTIRARISYLNKMRKELDTLNEYLQPAEHRQIDLDPSSSDEEREQHELHDLGKDKQPVSPAHSPAHSPLLRRRHTTSSTQKKSPTKKEGGVDISIATSTASLYGSKTAANQCAMEMEAERQQSFDSRQPVGVFG